MSLREFAIKSTIWPKFWPAASRIKPTFAGHAHGFTACVHSPTGALVGALVGAFVAAFVAWVWAVVTVPPAAAVVATEESVFKLYRS